MKETAKAISTQANIEPDGPDGSSLSLKTEEEKKAYGLTNIFGGFFQQNATTPVTPRKSIKGAVQPKKDKIPEERKKVATPHTEEKKEKENPVEDADS